MLKIFIAAYFAAQTCLAGTTAGAQSKFTPPNALTVAAAYNNASADAESLLNVLAITSGKPQEVEELKKHVGPKVLKKGTLKFKSVDSNTYSSDKYTVSLIGGKIRINGKDFNYDASKSVLANYKKFREDFSATKKSAFLDLLIPAAHAQFEDYDGPSPILFLFGFGGVAAALVAFFEGGGGGGAFAIAAGSLAATAAAGAGSMIYSGNVMADEAYTPTGLCQQKGSTYTNTVRHVSGDILTQDMEAKDGQLIITQKVNGEVGEVITIVKKGDAYEVSKIVANGKSVDPATDGRGKLGEYFMKAYKTCLNPTKEDAEYIAKVNQVGKDIKAGKIKLAEKTKATTKPAIENSTAQ